MGWAKVNKTGSSLADLATRSASDLNSGTLADARLSATLQLYAAIMPSANVQTLLGAANYGTFKTLLSLNNVENTALSTWAGTTNVTTLGTVATGTWNATTIAANKGGTGQSSYAVGDLLYASGATALSKLADVATGSVLISGGVATAPSWSKTTGITGTGALTSGSITSGFGSINVGANSITGGAISGTTGAFSAGLNVSGAPVNGTTGINLETGIASSAYLFRAYNRTASTYAPINIYSLSLAFSTDGGGTNAVSFTSTGLNNTVIGATTPATATVTNLALNTGSTSNVYIKYTNNGTSRWNLGIAGTETGSGNTGSDYKFDNYNDAGAQIATAISITRATGVLNALNGLAVTGSISSTGDFNIGGGSDFYTGSTGVNPHLNNANTSADTGIRFGNGYLKISHYQDQSVLINRTGNDGNVVWFGRSSANVGSISVTTTATAYNTSSDARLKTNIRDFTDSGRLIDALRPRLFDWKTGEKDTIGFVAQEEHAADPVFARIGAVTVGDDDPDTIAKQWQRSDQALVPILVAEIKALRARVANVEPHN